MAFEIAVININNFNFDQLDKPYSIENIQRNINQYIEFITVSSTDEMMELIVKYTKLTPELLGDTDVCFNNEKYLIQMTYLSLKKNNKLEDENNVNGVASYFAEDSEKMYGTCVLTKAKITDEAICIPKSITIDDITDVFYKKLVHRGMLLKVDSFEEFEFNNDPTIGFEDNSDCDNIRWTAINIFKFSLVMYFRLDPKNNKFNKLATRILGSYPVYGDVILTSKSSENSYDDMSLEICKNS